MFKKVKYPNKLKITEKKLDEIKSLYKEYILFGGYPKIVLTESQEVKKRYLQQIIDTYVRKDIRDLAKIKDIDKFNKLLEVLAEQSGNLLNINELANTCNLARQTIEKYLFILENTYIIKLVRPYHKNIRSELFKTPKIMFYDTGLQQMLWLKDIPKTIIGNVFETSIFSELVKKYSKNSIYFWRTKDKKEIDFILTIKNKIILIEVKMNFKKFISSTIKFFCNKYEVFKYHVIGLENNNNKKINKYPWDML